MNISLIRLAIFSLCLAVLGAFLFIQAAPVPAAKGGLPACQNNFESCTDALQVCDADLATCEARAQRLPATGQRTCWDTSFSPADCGGTGQDGEFQAGFAPSFTDNGLTITDHVTGLMWTKQDDNNLVALPCDPDDVPNNLDKNCQFIWPDAFRLIDALNTEPCFAGHCDWRVPNVKELVSTVNYGTFNPAVFDEFDTACVPGCMLPESSCAPGGTWTSTTDAAFPDNAFAVDVHSGGVWRGPLTVRKNVNDLRVRAVRGGFD
jgi:hypothetical protein